MMNAEDNKIIFNEIKENIIGFFKSGADCFIDLLIFLWSFISYVVLEILNFFQEIYASVGFKLIWLIVLLAIIFILRKGLKDLLKNPFQNKPISIEEVPPSDKLLKKDKIIVDHWKNFSIHLIHNKEKFILLATLIFAIIEFLDIGFSYFLKGIELDNRHIAIITCAVSILFPAILISILDYEKENTIASTPELLMKHSLISINGLVLFIILFRYAFNLHSYSLVSLSAISVFVAAVTSYRLLQARVSPTVMRILEKEIVQYRSYHSVMKSLEERIGYIKTEKFFKSSNKKILFSIHPLSFDPDQKIIEVRSSKEGVVDEIDIEVLNNTYNLLESYCTKNINKGSTYKESFKNNKQSNLEFYLSAYVGQSIQRNQLIAKIYFKSNDDVGEELFKKKILKCFLIKASNEQNEIKEQFNELQDNLKNFSISAIRYNKPEQFEKIKKYLSYTLDAQADMLQVFDIRYNAISSSNELGNRIFQSNADWKPLSRVLDTIAEMSRIALEKDRSKKPEIIGRIRDLILHLFLEISERKDILSCFELLRLNFDLWRQCTQNNKEAGAFISKSTLEYLRIFFRKIKYSFLQDSDGRLRKKEEQEYVIEFVKLVYFNIQDYLFTSICNSDLIQYQSFLDFTEQFPDFFKHERYDIELKLDSFTRTKKHHGLNKRSEQVLERLQAKKKIIDKIDNLKDKMYYGQGVLALMIKNGLTAQEQDISIPRTLIAQPLTRIPKEPIEAFKFLHQIEKENYDDFKDKWSKWEHFSLDGEAKICKFYGALNDYQRLVLIRSISQSNIPDDIVFDENLLDQNWENNFMMWKIQKEVDSTITYPDIDKSIQLALDLELIQKNNIEETRSKLMKFLDKYLRSNQRYIQRKIADQPIHQQRIEKIKKDFDDSFVKNAQLRRISQKTEGVDDGMQEFLGISEFLKRDQFIEKPFKTYVDIDSFGTDDGRNTAQFEDNEIFKEIINQCKPTKKLTLEEAVQQCVSKIDFRKACILLPSSMEANDSLFSTPYYIPNSQPGIEHLKKGKIVDADEFFEIDNINIPILTFFKKQNSTNHVVILEKESITIEQIPIYEPNSTLLKKSGFTFKLEDPKEDAKFRKELLDDSGNQKWLSQFKSQEEKEKMVSLFVRMSIREKIQIKINNPEKVFVAILKLQKPKKVE